MDQRSKKSSEIVSVLRSGGIVCMAADTIYGVFVDATNEEALRKLRAIKIRDDKPFIVLCANAEQLKYFRINAETIEKAQSYWPGKVSVIMTPGKYSPGVQANSKTIALRVPDDGTLRNIIALSGPLAAPSANPAGLVPATTIQEAKDYFGDAVDLYIDCGVIEATPSRIIEIDDARNTKIIRN